MSGQGNMHNLTTLIKRYAEICPESSLDGDADRRTGSKPLRLDWKT